jgi:hypothetical protein
MEQAKAYIEDAILEFKERMKRCCNEAIAIASRKMGNPHGYKEVACCEMRLLVRGENKILQQKWYVYFFDVDENTEFSHVEWKDIPEVKEQL